MRFRVTVHGLILAHQPRRCGRIHPLRRVQQEILLRLLFDIWRSPWRARAYLSWGHCSPACTRCGCRPGTQTSRRVSYSCLKPARLSVDATAVARVGIQDQPVHDTRVRSGRRRARRNEFPLLSRLAGLVLVKVDDLGSHQGLYKEIIPRRIQIRAWWPRWRSDPFHRIAGSRRAPPSN